VKNNKKFNKLQLYDNHKHDVQITRESPNYRIG